jgi:cytochrome c oxidase subunit 2
MKRMIRGGCVLVALSLQGCGGWQSVLGPRSPGAAEIETLWWVAFASTGLLALVVIGGLLLAVRRSLRAQAAREGEAVARGEQRFILLAGAAFPALFLIGFLVISVRTGASVGGPPAEPALTIEVVGHKFWWEVRYPDQGITTANEIRVPAEQPVWVRVTSADVIHSFWVPQLSPGKIDMVPGRMNAIWMQADEPGLYRGQCTEFCGVQHALMSLLVIALPEDEFEAWAEDRAAPRAPPEDPRILEGVGVFIGAGCGSCHAVEGISRPSEAGSPGPDLTDLAQRRTLGALTLENNRENLKAWVENPHRFKRGVRMPPHLIPEHELDALVSYLETLR